MDERIDPPGDADVVARSTEANSRAIPPDEMSVLLNLLPHILRTLRREPALAITLAYLLVAMAGIFYNYSFFEKFDIEILTLSQVNDLLVAGIQQPMALALVLSTFPLCWLFDKINLRGRRKRALKLAQLEQAPVTSLLRRARIEVLRARVLLHRYMGFVYLLLIFGYGWTFVSVYAEHRAAVVKKGDAPQVQIWLTGDNTALAAQAKTWTYLGAVSNYVFVYDHLSHHSEILPLNNILRIEPVAVDKKPANGALILPIL